ncbi:MAG TPA: fimbria/pilus outer membrane usher protein, partial [Casimicrobiaceae bacterium]|nr:fimbria/pilus outer membrane usher protein [Casimicrobiaceae bacterium]
TGRAGQEPSSPAAPSALAARDEELLLLADVNAQNLADTVLVLRSADGRIAVSAESLDRWRLRRPSAGPRVYNGTSYFLLDTVPGLTYSYDAAKQRLAITAPPQAFTGSEFANPSSRYPSATPSPPGAFLNYNLFASHASGASQYAGQFEAGFFNPYGVLVGSLLAQDSDDHGSATRLETTWTTDFPDRLASLRLGDTVNTPGAWGRAVRFGGVQYATNFATQPGFIAFPAIAANGQAALPSTVDVFVNNALVAQRTVPPGPFSITNIPTVNGSGNVQLVVRDLFGREQLISMPFYASVDLLQAGLSSFGYEVGFERNNFGIASNDYGRALVTATYSYGFTDQFTGQVHGEAMRDLGALGVTANYLIADIGVVTATVAGSGGSGAGALAGLGFQRQTGRFDVLVQGQWTSRDFRSIGVTADSPVPLRQLSGTIGYQWGAFGSTSMTYVAQDFREKPYVHVLSVGYSVRTGSWGFLSLSAAKTYGVLGSVAYFAALTIPWGDLSSASLSQNGSRSRTQGNSNDTALSVQRNLPAGEGYGYRVLARSNHDIEAGAALQNNVGTYTVDLARSQGENAARLSVAGGIGYVGGYPFLSRQISDSFGVVRVADYPGVTVLQDNQPVGRTGKDGYAMLPQLRAYDVNPVSIDQNDLPLDAQLDRLKIEVVPSFRSGLLLDFPVRRSRGATLRLRLDDGAPMPSGAIVRIVGHDEEFPVALEGEAYLTGLDRHNRLRASWKGASCEFDVEFPSSVDPLPDLGTFACHGVLR